jgi:hypothetical protein
LSPDFLPGMSDFLHNQSPQPIDGLSEPSALSQLSHFERWRRFFSALMPSTGRFGGLFTL